MDIKGKSAMVSGGASGLGAATVRMLAAGGARVMIADVNEQAGKALAQELGEAVSFVKMDVTSEKDVQNAVEEAAKRHGGL
ncbi:MAG TPA: SDR family NAD(P)-dependent oxidoreductase, partial [Candidatus Angelobacter sp.]